VDPRNPRIGTLSTDFTIRAHRFDRHRRSCPSPLCTIPALGCANGRGSRGDKRTRRAPSDRRGFATQSCSSVRPAILALSSRPFDPAGKPDGTALDLTSRLDSSSLARRWGAERRRLAATLHLFARRSPSLDQTRSSDCRRPAALARAARRGSWSGNLRMRSIRISTSVLCLAPTCGGRLSGVVNWESMALWCQIPAPYHYHLLNSRRPI